MSRQKNDKLNEEQLVLAEDKDTSILLFQFEDITIVRNTDNTITISKLLTGISDSCYARSAVGSQKNWSLYNEFNVLIDTGNQHGNRPFVWQGTLEPGLYTLETGIPSKNYTKHRIPGRNYQVTFRI
jgi:hypothetical protein